MVRLLKVLEALYYIETFPNGRKVRDSKCHKDMERTVFVDITYDMDIVISDTP